jgi:hypothetical protein
MGIKFFYQLPLGVLLLPLLLLVLLAAMEVGLRLGSHHHRVPGSVARESKSDVTLAAMLTLLGLMLAFTYSFSMSRADLRKQALIIEVNAISTAFLRADLAPEPERTELRLRLLDYGRSRLFNIEDFSTWQQVEDHARRSLQAQSRLWPVLKSIVAREEGMSEPQKALLVQAINQVLDAHTARIAVIYDRLPTVVLGLLLLIAASCMSVAAYSASARGNSSRWRMTAFAVILSALMYVIVDFDMIFRGFIRIDHHNMELLVKEMERDIALDSHGSPGLEKMSEN